MALAIVLLSLLGCRGEWEVVTDDGLVRATQVVTSDRRGRATLRVPVPEASHMLFTAAVDYPYRTFVHRLVDPDGAVVFDADDHWEEPYGVTGAISPKGACNLNWPIQSGDAALVPGTWKVEVGVIDLESVFSARVPITASAVFKTDDALDGGALVVNIVLAGAARDDAETLSATEDAIAHWATLYQQAGVALEVAWYEYENGALRAPGTGTRSDYVAIADATPLRSVNVVIVPQIEDAPGIYGIAGGIPGALVSTPHTAVTLSTVVNAGPDGRFSPAERRLFGETMAHEVGHYLGLFHPVESDWTAWDALGDTPDCSTEVACRSLLGDNLMFPYPLCDDTACAPQDALTADQRALANRYVGVR